MHVKQCLNTELTTTNNTLQQNSKKKKIQEDQTYSKRSSSWCGAKVQKGAWQVSSDTAPEQTLAKLMDSMLKAGDFWWQTEWNGAKIVSMTVKMLQAI